MISQLDQQSSNVKLAQALTQTAQKMTEVQKINFLAGYVCCLVGVLPDARNISQLKIIISNVNEAIKNQFISSFNFIEIFIQSSNMCKNYKHNILNRKVIEKLSQNVQNLIGQLVDNRTHIRQKWLRQQKPVRKESSILDEQTKRLIKKIQQSDLKNRSAQKKRQQNSQIRFFEPLQQEEVWNNQELRSKIQNSYVKIKCEICQQDIPFSDIGALTCGHIFHRACVRGHIEALVKEKKVDIPCPSGCGAYMLVVDVEEFIDGELRQKYDKFCFDVFVEKNQKDTSWCPTAGCTAVFSHDGVLDNYRCPVCRKHYCLNCRCQYHNGMSCAQYRITNSYGQNDKKFDQFVIGAKFKQCPKCKFWVERTVGCNSMSCRCGAVFCYNCGGYGCQHYICKNSGRK